MKILSWNIRGLNGSHKQEVVRNMIRDQRPDVFLIQETKMKKENIEKVSFGKDMKNMAIDSDGALGGLLSIWKESLEANIIFNEGNIFLMNFFNPKDHVRLFLLNLYAPNTRNSRRILWTNFF